MKKKHSKSSYYRLYVLSSSIFAICILIIGIFITAFSTKLFKDAKYKSIAAASDVFIDGFRDEYEKYNNVYSEEIVHLHKRLMKKYDMEIFLYDRSGNCLLSPDNNSETKPLSKTIIGKINDGDTFDLNDKEISSSEPMLMYGDRFSVTSQNGSGDRSRFYIVAYSPADSINIFKMKMVAFFCIVGIILFIAIRFIMKLYFGKYMTAAKEFSQITEKFSKKDFSERLDIKIAGEMREVAKNVNVLADYAASSDETSRVFIANVSHELRTPITTIGGFVSGILDGTIPKANRSEYLVLVSNEIKRLSILITSMLNMSRFESGTMKPNFTETNLTELVIKTVLMFEKKIEDKQLEIEGLDSDRLVAVADADLMQQVIYNLIENAVKFVNTGGTISFGFEKNNEGICSVSIRNTGEGLKNEEIKQVFDRFYKTDSSRGKDKTGLGLGLSISRKIVHLHSGHIVVKSVQSEYTEFSVQIPEKQDR